MNIISHIYIIEDLFVHRSIISSALEEIAFPNSKIKPISDYIAFYNDIPSLAILDSDIFIIDIDLKSFHTGIDYAKKIRTINENCYIVFLTADDKKGIDVINENIHATTYLVKESFNSFDIKNKLQNELHKIQLLIKKEYSNQDDRYIQFQVEDTFFIIKVADILYIETLKTMKGYLFLKTHSQELIIRSTIKNVKKELENIDYIYTGFKSLIINLNAISSFNKTKGEILFHNDDYIFGGRKIIEKLIDALN